MIVKHRENPLLIPALQAALVRLPEVHSSHKLIESKLYSMQSGFGGEGQVDKIFDSNSFNFNNRVFHGISLRSSGAFQIDTLFLAQKFAIVFEVKNIAGSLEFRENPSQLISTLDSGERRGYDCPAKQVEKNKELFMEWLIARGISMPVYGVVVLAYPKQIVDKGPLKTIVVFPSEIAQLIRRYERGVKTKGTVDLEWVTNEILGQDAPYRPKSICSIYSIEKDAILTGVYCESCCTLGMIRRFATWECLHCGKSSRSAHEKTLQEWFMIIGGKISNKECRRFLNLQSRQTTTRILKRMDLKHSGSFRYRKYEMK